MAHLKNINNTNITNIEYIDIDNIPVKTMTHISFVLEQKILNVYLNGKLLKIHKFLGTPIFNKMPMTFNYQKSFEAYYLILDICHMKFHLIK